MVHLESFALAGCSCTHCAASNVLWLRQPAGAQVADLGSLNGTLLNGEPISQARRRGRDYRLSSDDILQVRPGPVSGKALRLCLRAAALGPWGCGLGGAQGRVLDLGL